MTSKELQSLTSTFTMATEHKRSSSACKVLKSSGSRSTPAYCAMETKGRPLSTGLGVIMTMVKTFYSPLCTFTESNSTQTQGASILSTIRSKNSSCQEVCLISQFTLELRQAPNGSKTSQTSSSHNCASLSPISSLCLQALTLMRRTTFTILETQG